MLTRPMPPETLHQHIRRAWHRYVLPVLVDRNVDGLLAALVVADTSLDEVLYAEGYTGETGCERLRQAMHSFSNYPAVLAGHQIRNRIVHHPSGRRFGINYARSRTTAWLRNGAPWRRRSPATGLSTESLCGTRTIGITPSLPTPCGRA